MEKQALLRKLMRALNWGKKRKGIVTNLSALQQKQKEIGDYVKRLDALKSKGTISPEEYAKMSASISQQRAGVDKLVGRLTKWRTLGDRDRNIRNAISLGTAAAATEGIGLAGLAGLVGKNIYDQEIEQAKYVRPLERMKLEEELPALQDALAKRKQHGSWL